VYGATVGFTATGDTAIDALLAGSVNIANGSSADPRIQSEGLVTLTDPDYLLRSSNVVPLVSTEVADLVADVINSVSVLLTPEVLVSLNVHSTSDDLSPSEIASQWIVGIDTDGAPEECFHFITPSTAPLDGSGSHQTALMPGRPAMATTARFAVDMHIPDCSRYEDET
jgi:hypothetical protein